MRNRRPVGIWLTTVLLSSGTLLLSALLAGFLAVVSFRHGWVRTSPLYGIIAFLLVSAIIGTLLSAFFSKKVLNPLIALIKATQQVAEGNFDVRLEPRSKGEVGELIRNFNRMAEELSHTEMLRSDFVNNISHEIRTPVAAIENCATLLISGQLSGAEQREYAEMIADGARRLSALSRNVLSLSRLENQGIITERRRFRLDEQIRQAVVLLEPKWAEKRLELDIELSEVTYEGNPELMIQVWINLLENAIKFSNAGGPLIVRLSEAGGEALTTIEDRGVGMPEEVVGRIFEKFYQGNPSRAAEGNGLGLALVKRIVELSGGRVGVESRPGEGSRFSVSLPMENC